MFCLLSDFRFDGNFNTNVSKTISCDRLSPTVNSRAFNPGRDLNSGVFKTHTHTHTQCLSFKNPKPIFTYPAAAIATICKEQYYFPDIKSWKIFWRLEWDKKWKRLWNTWIRDLAHLRMEILFLSSHLSVFIRFPFKWPQLCTSVLLFPLYLLCLTNQEVYVFITLYTAPVSTAPLHIRYISFCCGKASQVSYSSLLTRQKNQQIQSQQIQ